MRLQFEKEAKRCRSVTAWLDLFDTGQDYRDQALRIPLGVLHTGPIEAGQELVAEARLPAGALPPLEAERGSLGWSISVKIDNAFAFDDELALELSDIVTSGPDPEAVAQALDAGSDQLEFDGATAAAALTGIDHSPPYSPIPGVELKVADPIVRPGESVSVEVRLPRFKKPPKELTVSIECEQHYAWEDDDEISTRANGSRTTYAEPQPLDPADPVHEIVFAIPVDQPFSYQGSAFKVKWQVIVIEKRRLRFQRGTGVPLIVLPPAS